MWEQCMIGILSQSSVSYNHDNNDSNQDEIAGILNQSDLLCF